MATITGYTAARMKQIEDSAIIDGDVIGDNLILKRFDGGEINAGSVRGPQGIQGPTGDVPEAPEDSAFYVRKDGAWVNLYSNLAPSNGSRYVMKNGAWVALDKPWTLAFDNTTVSPPAGFSALNVPSGKPWFVNLTGSGHLVKYRLEFYIDGTYKNVNSRFTFPVDIRPITDEYTLGYFTADNAVDDSNGSGLIKFSTSGQITTPIKDVVMSRTRFGGISPGIWMFNTGTLAKVEVNGSFFKASDNIPSGATPIS